MPYGASPMELSTRFAPAVLAKLRHDLMWRGKTLASMLGDVLAGEQPPELAALLAEQPGIRPDEVLRRALQQIEGRRRLLDAGDDQFGRCVVCGADLGLVALGEMPWADRCAAHAAA